MKNLINKIAELGRHNRSMPHLRDVELFKEYFDSRGNLKKSELDNTDASNCTRRELLLRYLLLNAVLDQGPDMEGVRELLTRTINELYKKEIRVLHTPELFFGAIGNAIEYIDNFHAAIKTAREATWQANNNSKKHYNLFMDGCSQTLSYAIFRWGTPLAVPLALKKDNHDETQLLLNYLQSFKSAEIMSQELKDNKKYGLGKAIGDKASHLFAKWMVYTFELTTKTTENWGQYSYEIPFDSNAGRVLFRTGFFFHYITEAQLIADQVIQKDAGKGGKHYIRVTNSRGKKIVNNQLDIDLEKYKELTKNHLKQARRNVLFQLAPIALIFEERTYSVGELDDGLMYIGTNFCFNTDTPKCDECPLKDYCKATKDRNLITQYAT